jgi:hypothetical protein
MPSEPVSNQTQSLNAIRRHLMQLRDAGQDEKKFDMAYRDLLADTKLNVSALNVIAGAYIGAPEDLATREAAIGSIEQHFYAQRGHAKTKSNQR